MLHGINLVYKGAVEHLSPPVLPYLELLPLQERKISPGERRNWLLKKGGEKKSIFYLAL